MNYKKTTFLVFLTTTLLGVAYPLFAEEHGYTPLVSLPGISTESGVNLTAYLQQLFNLSIMLAGILAVLMVVVGGIQYMMSEAVTDKSDATKRIWSSVIGLLLVLSSWLILNTINPDLLDLNVLKITPTEQIQQARTPTDSFVGVVTVYCYEWRYVWDQYIDIDACQQSVLINNECKLSTDFIRNCESDTLDSCELSAKEKNSSSSLFVSNYLSNNKGCVREVVSNPYCFTWTDTTTNSNVSRSNCSFATRTSCQSFLTEAQFLSTQKTSLCSGSDGVFRLTLFTELEVPTNWPSTFSTKPLCENEATSLLAQNEFYTNVSTACARQE